MRFFKKLTCLLMVAALALPSFASCGDGESGAQAPKVEKYDAPVVTATEYEEDYDAFHRAEGETQKEIDVLNLTGCSWYDLYVASAIQGYVNRVNPKVYLIREGSIVQDDGTAPIYWLNNLDVSYGEGVYTVNEIESLEELIVKYRDSVKGAILYHERLLASGTQLVNQSAAATIYGDMAVANYTTMLAAQKDAIPVTQAVLDKINAYLAEKGEEEIEVVGSTIELMSIDGEQQPSGSKEVWANVYNDALDKVASGEWQVSDKALGHNGTWNACWFDYIFQNKIFTYNRITSISASPSELEIEQRILDVTKDNTAMMGVWHLVADLDEASLVSLCDDNEKFFVVCFGTWKMSWSSGLPRVELKENTEKLEYDPSKVYVSFAISETDNNTYTYYFMRSIYDNALRGDFAMTWQINQAMYDLNPNIIAYMNNTFTEKDSYALGEAGVGYIRSLAARADAGDFVGLTDEYCERMNVQGGINVMYPGVTDALPYVDRSENINSMTIGYLTNDNVEKMNYGMNYYFHDTPVFVNLGCDSAAPTTLLDLNVDGGTFINVRLPGFVANLPSIKSVIDQLPENYEVVNQTQLIDLYTQKMSAVCNDVNNVQFNCSMTETESAFLWYSDNYNRYNQALVAGQEEYRYGERDEEVIYKFRMDSEATKTTFDMELSGEYKVQLSTDYKNWTTVARYDIKTGDNDYMERRPVSFSVPEEMVGKTVYLRVSDPTQADGVGYRLYSIAVATDKEALNASTVIKAGVDERYLVGGKLTEEGRTGEVIYKLPFDKSVSHATLGVIADGDVEISMSINGNKYYPVELQTLDRTEAKDSYHYATLNSLAGNVYVKIKTDANVKSVKVSPLETVKWFEFSPCGSETDRMNGIFADDNTRVISGASSHCKLTYGDYLMYAFRMGEDVSKSPVLELRAAGMFKLEVSNNGKNWTTLKSVEVGENITEALKFDMAKYAIAGNTLYVRLSKSENVGANASVYNISLS